MKLTTSTENKKNIRQEKKKAQKKGFPSMMNLMKKTLTSIHSAMMTKMMTFKKTV